MTSSILSRLSAELIGTAWLVLGGCGAAVLSAAFPSLGIGFTGVAIAFGVSLMSMAYAFGNVSGAHFNPAVTVGLAAARRFPVREIGPYVLAQLVGAMVGAMVLYLIADGQPGFSARASGFASNGYGAHSPGLFSLASCLAAEIVLTFGFVMVVLGATSGKAPAGFAPLAIGVALTLVHLVGIPVTNTSVNPARSTGAALVQGSWALQQLWLFWLAPLVGGLLAGVVHAARFEKPERRAVPEGENPQLA